MVHNARALRRTSSLARLAALSGMSVAGSARFCGDVGIRGLRVLSTSIGVGPEGGTTATGAGAAGSGGDFSVLAPSSVREEGGEEEEEEEEECVLDEMDDEAAVPPGAEARGA